ncbi:hypothetical protein RUM44_008341 [Polyplax serrata]|uniref:Uncharacterized protein n=1 Tax=Polyplax serrata TaxID=468196 RepID=A0ABR1BC28_POLSC
MSGFQVRSEVEELLIRDDERLRMLSWEFDSRHQKSNGNQSGTSPLSDGFRAFPKPFDAVKATELTI